MKRLSDEYTTKKMIYHLPTRLPHFEKYYEYWSGTEYSKNYCGSKMAFTQNSKFPRYMKALRCMEKV